MNTFCTCVNKTNSDNISKSESFSSFDSYRLPYLRHRPNLDSKSVDTIFSVRVQIFNVLNIFGLSVTT